MWLNWTDFFLVTICFVSFRPSMSQVSLTLCTAPLKGQLCVLTCETADLSGNIFFRRNNVEIAKCTSLPGLTPSCSPTVVPGYEISQSAPKTTYLNISSLSRTNDDGQWSCEYGGITDSKTLAALTEPSASFSLSGYESVDFHDDADKIVNITLTVSCCSAIKVVPVLYNSEFNTTLSELTATNTVICADSAESTYTYTVSISSALSTTYSHFENKRVQLKFEIQLVNGIGTLQTAFVPNTTFTFQPGETTTNPPTTTTIPETTNQESTATTEVTSTQESTSSTAVPSSASTVVTTVTGTSHWFTTTIVTSTNELTEKEKIIIITASSVGGFLFILIIILVIYCCTRKSRTSQNLNQNNQRDKQAKRAEQQIVTKNGDRYQARMKQEDVNQMSSGQRGYQHGQNQHLDGRAYQTPQQYRDPKASKKDHSRQPAHLYPELNPSIVYYPASSNHSYNNPSYTGPHAMRDGGEIYPIHKSSRSPHPESRDPYSAYNYQPNYEANWHL